MSESQSRSYPGLSCPCAHRAGGESVAGLEIGLKPGLADRSAQCCAGRQICYDALDPVDVEVYSMRWPAQLFLVLCTITALSSGLTYSVSAQSGAVNAVVFVRPGCPHVTSSDRSAPPKNRNMAIGSG